MDYKLLDDIIRFIKVETISNPPQVCYTCRHLSEDRECRAYQEKPPLEALSQKLNCKKWSDEIPF